MAIIDLIILGFVGFGAYKGYHRGFIVELFGIVGFVITIILGYQFINAGADKFADTFGLEKLKSISPYFSFFIVLGLSGFLVRKMGWLMRKAVRFTFLGIFDKILGGILGGIGALFGLSLVLLLSSKINLNCPEKWTKNNLYLPQVQKFAPELISKITDLIPFKNVNKFIDFKNYKNNVGK